MKLYHLTVALLYFVAEGIAAAIPSHPIFTRNVTKPKLDFAKITPSAQLEWYPCLTANFTCAVLEVPLDYAKPQGNRALVPLLKYKASRGKSQGIVLTNPGGPGSSAVEFLSEAAPIISGIVGYNYDVVAWEPRGIGHSIPMLNCSETTLAASKFDLYTPNGDFQKLYEIAGAMGKECQEKAGGTIDAGPRMSTSIIARDIASILDAYAASPESAGVKDPSLLNFWGFSYGTSIGQTFASMFPQRVGRMALDGIVDAEDAVKGDYLTWLQSSDETFSTFFMYCHLAGSNCSYFTGTSVHDIFLRFERTLARLDPVKATKNGWQNATAIGIALEGLKALTFQSLYSPHKGFPVLADILLAVESAAQNITMETLAQLDDLIGQGEEEDTNGAISITWLAACSCTDSGNVWNNATLEEVTKRVNIFESQSFIGGRSLSKNIIACTKWDIKPDERFAGPFGGITQTPILFISNTRDPVTPITNGRKASQTFQNSELLTIDGTGHTSVSSKNKCAFEKINAYFQKGVLPGKDNFCSMDTGPWNITISGGLEKRSDWEQLQTRIKALV